MLLFIHFMHPEFLYALFFLSIPVILHLFSLKRYKKVYFSNFNFLSALQQQKKNSSRLKNLLLLLFRLFIISCIVVAFATPYIRPSARQTAQPHTPVVLYADHSFSMSNSGVQGNLLDEAKKQLYDIIKSYPQGTGFRLITNQSADDILLNKEQAITALSQLQISPESKTLSQICQEARELCQHQAHTLFIASDFQKKNCDFPQLVQDSLQNIVLLLLKPENLNNLYVREVEFTQAFHRKNQSDKIRITLANSSPRDFHNIPVTLTINDKKKSITPIDLPANSEKALEINYQNTEEGFYKGLVEISDFPVVFDNRFFFSYGVEKAIEILYLYPEQENPFFGKLFSDTTAFHFCSQPGMQAANLNFHRYHLIILDRLPHYSSGQESQLEEYLLNGGNLLVIPGKSVSSLPNRFLQKIRATQYGTIDSTTQISHIEIQSSLFRDVFEQEKITAQLPRIQQFYQLTLSGKTEKLLTDKYHHPLLTAQTFGKGNLYVSAFDFSPANSDMVYHPLFVPLLINMASNVNSFLQSSYLLNTTQPVILDNKAYEEGVPVKIRKDDQSFEFIPDIRKNFSGDLVITNASTIREAGLYDVIQKDTIIGMLAWNYDRSESQMEFSKEEELAAYFPSARIEDIQSAQKYPHSAPSPQREWQDPNRYLTFWFILFAFLALLAEQVIWSKKLN